MIRTLRLTLAYDGTAYCGWQVQPNGPTVQQTLADAVQAVTGEGHDRFGYPMASGRTDAGVHALGQVVRLRTATAIPCVGLGKALNAHLPDDVVVRDVAEAPETFDPAGDATGKLYRYLFRDAAVADPLLRHRVWQVRTPLDEAAMGAAAAGILGRHDFRSFESHWPNRASSVRTVFRCDLARVGDEIRMEIEADGFLYNMVRAIAGSLHEIGRGRWAAERLAQIVAAGDRGAAGPTAPPQGLYLVRVDYPPSVPAG